MADNYMRKFYYKRIIPNKTKEKKSNDFENDGNILKKKLDRPKNKEDVYYQNLTDGNKNKKPINSIFETKTESNENNINTPKKLNTNNDNKNETNRKNTINQKNLEKNKPEMNSNNNEIFRPRTPFGNERIIYKTKKIINNNDKNNILGTDRKIFSNKKIVDIYIIIIMIILIKI